MPKGLWDQGNSAERPRRVLKSENRLRNEARQRPCAGVEMWQPARFPPHLDEDISLALASTVGATRQDRGEPSPLLELQDQALGQLGHAAVQEDDVIRAPPGVPRRQRALDDLRISDPEVTQSPARRL